MITKYKTKKIHNSPSTHHLPSFQNPNWRYAINKQSRGGAVTRNRRKTPPIQGPQRLSRLRSSRSGNRSFTRRFRSDLSRRRRPPRRRETDPQSTELVRRSPARRPQNDVELIKRQYRKLALLLHPDKNKFPFADSAFKLVINMYVHLTEAKYTNTPNNLFKRKKEASVCQCSTKSFSLQISLQWLPQASTMSLRKVVTQQVDLGPTISRRTSGIRDLARCAML
ncbi:putative DnaJ domain, Chaperone J-domain superfamily [Helianthus debilis subsp. tardiflorus]